MQVQKKREKMALFPNLMRDANSKAFKHIRGYKEYRKYFEKVVRDLYRKKHYHDSSILFFLRLYCALAPLEEGNHIFRQITTDSLQFINETRIKCAQKYQELKESVQDEETIISIENLEHQYLKIESLQAFILHLHEATELDYNQVVDDYLRKIYAINSFSNYHYFTNSQQNEVRKLIDNYQNISLGVQKQIKRQYQKQKEERLKSINQGVTYNRVESEALRIQLFDIEM